MSEEQLPADSHGKMVVFGAKQIRRIWHEEQWFFSVVDIIAALTDSDNPRELLDAMKRREENTSEFQLSTICVQLKLTSPTERVTKPIASTPKPPSASSESIPSPRPSRSSAGWQGGV